MPVDRLDMELSRVESRVSKGRKLTNENVNRLEKLHKIYSILECTKQSHNVYITNILII